MFKYYDYDDNAMMREGGMLTIFHNNS